MNIQQLANEAFSAIGFLGVTSFSAWAAVRFLGEKWIEKKFGQQLEAFKHDRAVELARLKVEIDSALSSVVRLQEKEFEVLPKAWHRLFVAYNQVAGLVSPLQTYPDLSRMSDARFDEFLSESKLVESEKQELRNSKDRNKLYQQIIFYHRLNEVRAACRRFNVYVMKNAVFLPPELRKSFEDASSGLWSAVVSKQVGHESNSWEIENQGWDKVEAEVKPLYEAVEKAIQARLRGHGRRTAFEATGLE